MLPQDRTDPSVRVGAACEIVGNYFMGRTDELRAGDHAFEVAKAAALLILAEARVLCRFDFWDDVRLPDAFRRSSVPESDVATLRNELRAVDESLRYQTASRQDLAEAMNSAADAFKSMQRMFAVGRIAKDVADIPRYRCAAMLPAIDRVLEDVWIPIREMLDRKIVKKRTA